jgi:hypothetical protein
MANGVTVVLTLDIPLPKKDYYQSQLELSMLL